jgi:transketolase
MQAARFGADVVDHYTYVIAGDGCLMEGISHEAISLAGHLKLDRLIVLYDDNHISIDGATDLSCSDDALARFAASGWQVQRVDGHDPEAVDAAITTARAETSRPSLIACRTVIGYGAPNKQGSSGVHGAPLGEEEIAAAREQLEWPYAPFEIPETIRDAWLETGAYGKAAHDAWRERLARVAPDERAAFEAGQAGSVDDALAALAALAERQQEQAPKLATRQASQKAIEAIAPAQPNLVGGSADLTGSNLTRADGQQPVQPGDYAGSYIHYGIREHAMGAVMNGIALHGGFVPYGGTFLAFADYARPSIRLSALMGQRVVYVMTHDSIGLGEDGPTHQPVEHLASLRAMPNLNVFRPADAVETAHAWACALESSGTPSLLALSRQGLPTLPRQDATRENTVSRGAYVLREADGERDVTIIATGSEVALAVEAADALAGDGIRAAVVSAPCFELFAAQSAAYRQSVLGTAPRIGVEAAVEADWARWLGEGGRFIGMRGFGASAPAGELYKQFGITREALVEAARAAVAENPSNR